MARSLLSLVFFLSYFVVSAHATQAAIRNDQNIDSLYEAIHQIFLKSDFCDPLKMSGDLTKKPSPYFLNALLEDIKLKTIPVFARARSTGRVYRLINPQQILEGLHEIAHRYELSDAEIQVLDSKIEPLLENAKETSINFGNAPASSFSDFAFYDLLIVHAKIIFLQKMIEQGLKNPELTRKDIEKVLIRKHIYQVDDVGNLVCPFVPKDSFTKAYQGYKKAVSMRIIQDSGLLTIVDYSAPSNQRRLFELDLNHEAVLHHTWSAQGAGNSSYRTTESADGSNPLFSNEPGSFLSSSGFILAVKKSYSNAMGNIVLLKGLQALNSQIMARKIYIHSWRTPGSDFLNQASSEEAQDTYRNFMNFVSPVSLNLAAEAVPGALIFNRLSSAVDIDDKLKGTQGCLGVAPQDLEGLRVDLPGTLIFSYPGANAEITPVLSEAN
jgi:hypothetical protein